MSTDKSPRATDNERVYRSTVGDVRVVWERLADLDESHSEEITARQLKRDQGTLLPQSDQVFESRYRQERAVIKRDYDEAVEKAQEVWQLCLEEGGELPPMRCDGELSFSQRSGVLDTSKRGGPHRIEKWRRAVESWEKYDTPAKTGRSSPASNSHFVPMQNAGHHPLRALQWTWSPSLGAYYSIDARTGDYVLPNGRRLKLPSASAQSSALSPPAFLPYSYPGSSPESGADVSAPPVQANAWHPHGFSRTGQNDPGPSLPNADERVRKPVPQAGSISGKDHPAPPFGMNPPISAFAGLNLGPRQPLQASQPASPSPRTASPQTDGALETCLLTTKDGDEILQTADYQSRVITHVQSDPPDRITDPALLGVDYRTHKKLWSTGRTSELLEPAYQTRPSGFFKRGRVFLVLWAEPAGGSLPKTLITATQDLGLIPGRHGEKVFSKVRRFIVIVDSGKYCSTLPIVTYGDRGVSGDALKSEHGIVYTGKTPPDPISGELPLPGETGMLGIPIRVDPDDRLQRLGQMSRINYGKIYTVEHNVKVKPLGMVNRNSLRDLVVQFQAVWTKRIGLEPIVSGQSQHSPRAVRDKEQQRSALGNTTPSDARQASGVQPGRIQQERMKNHVQAYYKFERRRRQDEHSRSQRSRTSEENTFSDKQEEEEEEEEEADDDDDDDEEEGGDDEESDEVSDGSGSEDVSSYRHRKSKEPELAVSQSSRTSAGEGGTIVKQRRHENLGHAERKSSYGRLAESDDGESGLDRITGTEGLSSPAIDEDWVPLRLDS